MLQEYVANICPTYLPIDRVMIGKAAGPDNIYGEMLKFIDENEHF